MKIRDGSIMKVMEKFTKKQKMLGIAGIIVLILLIIYIGVAVFFQNHFGFRTTVNGVKAAGKSPKQIEQLIKKEIDGYEITLEERENHSEVLKGTQIDLRTEFDGSLEQEMKKQSGFAWPLYLFRTSEIEVETMITYDKEALKKELRSLACMDESKMKMPENATISEYSEGTGYEIVPEKEGTKIDDTKLFEVMDKSVTNLKKSVSLEEEGCYIEPQYTKDSEELKTLLDTMNRYAKAEITYEFGSKSEKLDGNTISQWITVNDNMEVGISQEKISEYMTYLAENYNTAGKAKSFQTSYGSTISISGGDYGWRIDKSAEAEALTANIMAGDKLSKEPVYAKTANSHEENDYGNTYVEVNLTAQHMYYYKNGSLVMESDFVSGNEAKGWNTPTGVYGLYYKQRDKTLRGEDYATPVSFWMPFNGGVGFHDATWRKDFGGNYYRRSGSHGCVNLPYSAAKKLYENIESGCPIFVYTLSGTESAKAKAQDAAAGVISAINSIGNVSLESRDTINNVRAQYNALDEMARGYVTNYDVLAAAEAQLATLDAQVAAAAAEQQAQSQAQPVIDAINTHLVNQVINLDKKGIIQEIRRQYDTLSDAAKAKVTNYFVLTEAERMIASLESGV